MARSKKEETLPSANDFKCPTCGEGNQIMTVDSRPILWTNNSGGRTPRKLNYFKVRRRRKCRKCGHRFTTVEIPTEVSLLGEQNWMDQPDYMI